MPATFAPKERILLDYIFIYGFSVAETAFVFGLDHAELVRRLRLMWAAVRRPVEIPESVSG